MIRDSGLKVWSLVSILDEEEAAWASVVRVMGFAAKVLGQLQRLLQLSVVGSFY
jgi:hypothetical protein